MFIYRDEYYNDESDREGIADALRDGPYRRPALVPRSPWLDDKAPPAPALPDDVVEGTRQRYADAYELAATEKALLVCLDQVSDPHNLPRWWPESVRV